MAAEHLAAPGLSAGTAARSLFSKFRALLEANTAALTTMAAMERMLGGDYIFDRAFLERSAREVTDLAHQAVYAVNAMSGNRYVALYDRFMAIAAAVEDILAGRPGEDADKLVRPLTRLRLEDRPKVGPDGAALGELAAQLGLAVPRAWVVTPAAWRDGGLALEAYEDIATALGDRTNGLDAASLVAATVSLVAGNGATARRTERDVPAQPEVIVATLEGLARVAIAELAQATGPIRTAALIAAAPPAALRGRIQTAWLEADQRTYLRLDVWPEAAPAAMDTFFLDRSHPFASRRCLRVVIPAEGGRPDAIACPDPAGQLPEADRTALAGQAMAAERLLGWPLELGFYQEPAGEIVFESVHPLAPARPLAAPAPSPAAMLLSGGEAACLGAASGVVFPVDETTPAVDFPFGAIAVARSASPALAPILRRAGAMVAEVGDAAGHLAAVAREYRVPALFGLPGALTTLRRGMVVTVDAESGLVTDGAAETRPAPESGLSPDDPEYLTLRRLLRRIVTLTLTDPAAPEFSASGCRTLHDVLHFAHDRAVAVLADLRQTGDCEHVASLLPLPVPLDLRVLDIGGGLAPGGKDQSAVRSRPLAALLAGITAPGLWDTAPARLGLGDIIGAMAQPLPVSGGNLAIAARAYCNVSLRLGYHFTVVDAYIDRNPEKNTISFRFVGGLADAAGRAARAAFLSRVLARYDFKVETAGDLVVARLKLVEPETAEAALRLVGNLCAFARQRDTELTNAADAAALEKAFYQACDQGRARQEHRP